MKMSFYNNGSALILILSFFSIALIICTQVWRSTTYMVELSIQKQDYLQKIMIAEGVFRYMAKYIHTHFLHIVKKLTHFNDGITVELSDWPGTPVAKKYTPLILIKRLEDTRIALLVQLHEHGVKETVSLLKGDIVLNKVARDKEKKQVFHIENWQYV